MKKTIIKNISLGIACLLGVGGAIATASILSNNKPFEEARADGIQYISRSWDETNKIVKDTSSTCETYTTVNSYNSAWENGWYVVSSDVTISSRISVTGTVNLILCDGKTLTANNGIRTADDAILNVYSQSGGSGSLITSTSTNTYSAIGGQSGNVNGGTVNIYGGNITATSGYGAAGIGGGQNGDGGEVTIYGGNITATGGNGGAGIGSGSKNSVVPSNSKVIVYGGSVTANGGSGASGISGGARATGGEVSVYGGTVIANAGGTGAGIGGGTGADGGTVNIYGGSVTANGGASGGSGVGGGASGKGGEVFVYGGTLTALGGDNGAGIGGGYKGDGGSFTMYGGTVNVNDSDNTNVGCGIGPGRDYAATHPKGGTIDIRGGTLTAYGGTFSAAIGGGYSGLGGDITISGGEVHAYGGSQAAGIGNGQNGKEVNINISGGTIISQGGSRGAGIGGGYNAGGLNITISGGTVIATGGQYASGLGGGNDAGYATSDATTGTITITGGNVTGIAGERGPYATNANGIGNGCGNCKDTKIIVGEGLNVLGSDEGTPSEDDEYTDYGSVRYQYMTIKHVHHWSYSKASEDSISVICTTGHCPTEEGLLLTLATEDFNYDGNAKTASFVPGYDIEAFPNPTINYYQNDILIDECINIGTYEARVTFGEVTATKEFKISQGIPTGYDIPDGLEATYGDNLSSVALPDKWAWKNPNDKVGNAGIREHIAIYTPTDPNYKAVEETLTVTVAKADPSYTVPTGLKALINKPLSSITLPEGWSWVDPALSTGEEGLGKVFKANYIPADTTNYNSVYNIDVLVDVVAHTHNFVYTASGASITAECQSSECPITTGLTITINSPSNLVFDGNAKIATIASGYNEEAFVNPTIKYYQNNQEVEECINVGNYTASVTYGGKTASLDFSISKASSSLDSNPTGVAGLIYTGNAQELITAGTTSGGELKYSLDGTNYSSSIPTGTNAGDYTVYYKIFGDSNHNDSEEQSLVVSINKATVDPVGTLYSTYGKTLGDVILPSGWAWDDPTSTSVGNAGNHSFNATFAEQPNYNEAHQAVTINVATIDPDPVGTLDATFGQKLSDVALPNGWAWDDATQSVGNVGSHDFVAHYTAVDANHHDKDASITVNVSQATPTGYDIPTDLNATYGDTLSSVALPDKWAWKNPNDKVGNAGIREHIAIYTPTDPNYIAVENILTVTVAKANPTYTLPTDIEMYSNETLSNVTLPSGFSWMDGSIKPSSLGENTFKVRYTPVDTANYNVIDNIDLEVNVKWKVVDPSSSSTSIEINGADEAYTTDISVRVEVKTDISIEQKHNEYASLATNNFVKPNEDIVEIYDVKLIRTTNGVEEEIQPIDIKPGTKIIVSMAIPEELVGKEFRLLHIHNSDDITEVTNYAVSKDGKTLTVEVDRLSEFAFIGATDADNGFIYSATISNILVYVFFGIFGLLLIIGLIVLIKLLKDRNNLKKESKAYSIAIAAPLALAVTYTSTIMIVLYVIAALTVIVWASDLVLFISNKIRKRAKLDEAKDVKKDEAKPVETGKQPEPVKPVVIAKEATPVVEEKEEQPVTPITPVMEETSNEIEEEEVITTTDEKGNIFQIRFIKSFTAKLIQSPDETKKYYEELKNYVLSYKKTTSRVSWHYDSINSGRNQVLKFAIRGKTLCLYYPLNVEDYNDTKYKVEAVDSKKFEEVPCLYRIKNDRRRDYAKDLIDTVMNNLGLVKGEEQHEVYSNLPYEENKPLISRGLIKELKVQVSKQEEQVIESHEDEEGNEVVLSQDNTGNVYETRYVKSFRARLIEASEEAKEYYKELRDYILSYQDVDESISWLYDSINYNREQLFKLNIRGKTLCIYYALDTSKVGEKYKVENSDTKKYSKVPCLYRISNPRRVKLAKELIDRVMRKHKLILGEEYHDTYHLKNKSRDELIKKGLIKEVKILIK